jgi:hypothetical protein
LVSIATLRWAIDKTYYVSEYLSDLCTFDINFVDINFWENVKEP